MRSSPSRTEPSASVTMPARAEPIISNQHVMTTVADQSFSMMFRH